MEQILAFVLGVGAVAFVWAVVVAFKTAKKVNDINVTINDIYQVIRENNEMINRRIDQEIDRVDQNYRECISHTDSRVDRLESKITTKEILKG
jgi:site-specific DNA-adenine methylase